MTRFSLTLPAILAALLLYLVLLQPNHPAAMTWGALMTFPLEWPALLLGLLALGTGRAGLGFRVLVVVLVFLIAVLKAADYAMFTALARGFNPVSDLALISAGVRLLMGTLGPLLTSLAVLGALLAVTLLAAGLWWATGVMAAVAPDRRRLRAGAAAVALLLAGVAVAEVGDTLGRWDAPIDLPGAAFTARVGVERWVTARATLADLRAFKAAAVRDPYAGATNLLDVIDRDVILIFVESYGRTSLDTPYFSQLHRATLAEHEARLAGSGLAMGSGILASPTRGGQSWLAHATFANGLWVDGQTRYGAVLASRRRTLFHLAAEAGFHTAAVMPQITLKWPESEVMGFETILAAKDLGYAGSNFNWVTMPDQFTFLALDRLLRSDRPDDRPLFIQLATGSSHAPWVPVPDLVPWDAIDDGHIFDAIAASGDTPDVVWRDRTRVRAQYRLAIDYALRTVFAYALRHADDPPLMIIVGDHQAAGFVALDERPDVPIHVIGPAHLVGRAVTDWNLSEGLLPPRATPVIGMDAMRDRILHTFTRSAGGVSD